MKNDQKNKTKGSGVSRVRDLDPMHLFMPYIMPNRCEAEVYMNEKVDITEALAYVHAKNADGLPYKMTLFHLLLAATAKTFLLRPYLNRYIAGKRYYQRELVSMSFVAKKQFADHGEESIMIIEADGEMTLDLLSRKVSGDIREVRKTGGNDLDGVLKMLRYIPRPVLTGFAHLLNLVVYYGWMPKFLQEMDPYHTSVMLANLGSIKIGAPYHHLNNYGTNSVMITIGEMHQEYRPGPNGEPEIRNIVELGITLDERIGDGYYFAKSVKLLEYLISHPTLLETAFGGEVILDD